MRSCLQTLSQRRAAFNMPSESALGAVIAPSGRGNVNSLGTASPSVQFDLNALFGIRRLHLGGNAQANPTTVIASAEQGGSQIDPLYFDDDDVMIMIGFDTSPPPFNNCLVAISSR